MKTKYYLLTILLASVITAASAQYSLDFNGDGDYVALNGTDFAPPWSVEVMVNKNETDNYQHLLTSTDGNSGIRVEQWYGTQLGFTQSGVADWYFNYVCPIGQWVQISITNDGTDTKLYVDGTFNSSVNASINFPMKWISKNTNDASLKAKIDELRIWDIVLSETVISQYAGQPAGPSHPNYANLLHYYKFDEGSGNICYDSAGSLHGTIYGAVYYIDTDKDAGVSKLVAPANNPDNYSWAEPLIIRVKNYGYEDITEDFDVSYTLDGILHEIITIEASITPFLSNSTIDIEFTPVNMNTSGSYDYQFYTSLPGDENLQNDTLTTTLVSNSHVLGNITDIEVDTNTVLLTSGNSKIRVIFYKDDMFRIWLAPTGNFSNPASNHIVVSYDYPLINIDWSNEGDHFLVTTDKLALRAYKSPLRFELYESDNQTLIWKEYQGLDYGTRTFQYLQPHTNEYFYGGGMQNGYFSHKGTKIKISKEIEHWDDGAVPNPAPFYMSSFGYGAFRNTFSKGEYDFRDITANAHEEYRFDCFYFYGPSLKQILDGYTELTGRPILPPRWGLELGDADCYNKNGQTTPDVIELVADEYRERDLPGGWILPNDGYGCGYTQLEYVVDELHERGFYTGLWTEDGVAQIAWEVGTAGTRACKLDVAWVGSGYLNALNACKAAYEGIEENCDERGFVWSVCGWAGTQRYSVIWSGDQSGNFEYIRFHIPTIIGSGLSGFSMASSDVDGIFGGSGFSYLRDLQWKTFIPVTYAMSGWATNDKHPWNYGDAITDINRKYLKLKMRLTPYMYTYCNVAYESGTPVVRAMVLEYPGDPLTWDNTTQYQFMSGEWMLVAPVYTSQFQRDSIYFPEGRWIDYWNGDTYDSPMFLNDYEADINTCPVFIKEGAIIPMYPGMLYDNQFPKDPLTLDIYPGGNTSFELYEDDGLSREHRNGAYSKTLIQSQAPAYGQSGPVNIDVGEYIGDYNGKPTERAYRLEVHVQTHPQAVLLNSQELNEYSSLEEMEQANDGWFFDPADRQGIVHAKTQALSTASSFNILIDIPVKTGEQKEQKGIKIFPNPTGGIFEIRSEENEILALTVFDISGREIHSVNTASIDGKQAIIELSSQEKGIYIIQVSTIDGMIKEKVVIQ
ncbi:MAG: glycoside hydrolase family 31 protein [Bacteroidales bacterium]|nr:glycoside hydrolase family 31 protein [Bacteroidales bacterium]